MKSEDREAWEHGDDCECDSCDPIPPVSKPFPQTRVTAVTIGEVDHGVKAEPVWHFESPGPFEIVQRVADAAGYDGPAGDGEALIAHIRKMEPR